MNSYTTNADGVTTRADNIRNASKIIGRRIYGKRGTCTSLNLGGTARDKTSRVYQAFVGRPVHPETPMPGRSIWIYEHVAVEG